MKKILIIILLLFARQATKAADSVYVCTPCGSSCDETVYEKAGICMHCSMVLIKESKEVIAKRNERPTICFYLQDGVEVLDFAGPMEAFSYAGFTVYTASKEKKTLRSQGILEFIPAFSIKDAPPYDILAVFGGNASGAFNDPEVIDWVKSKQASTKYYFSVCTGAFIFAKAGLLDNLTATTFHLSIDALRSGYPKTKVLSNVRFVDNGKVITTAGISAGIDGALHMIAKLKGEKEAKRVALMMEYDKWVPGEGLIIK